LRNRSDDVVPERRDETAEFGEIGSVILKKAVRALE